MFHLIRRYAPTLTVATLAALAWPLVAGCRGTGARPPTTVTNLTDDASEGPPTGDGLVEIDAKAPHLSNGKIDVTAYDVDLTFKAMDEVEVPARVSLTLTTLTEANDVRFHMNEKTMAIDVVEVDGRVAPHRILDGQGGAHGLTGDVLSVDLGGPRPAGSSLVVNVRYRIKPTHASDRGLLFRKKYEGSPIFVTRNWPYYARYWLPSNDHPGDTATFAVSLHVPPEAIGAANGALEGANYRQGSGVGEGGLRTFVWRQATPIPVYGLNISVGPLDVVEETVCIAASAVGASPAAVTDKPVDCATAAHKIPVVYYVQAANADREEFLLAAKKGARSLVFFSSLLGLYPYQKLGFVTAPHPFNMESVSLIVMVSPDATVHEVAHHWWGNTVYFKHWGDFWISEGFTTYFTGLYDEFVDGTNTACSQTSGRLNGTPDTDPLVIFDNTPYCKGAAAIAALRQKIATLAQVQGAAERALFFRLSRELFVAYRFKRLTTQTLVAWLGANTARVISESGGPAPNDQAVASALRAWTEEWFAP